MSRVPDNGLVRPELDFSALSGFSWDGFGKSKRPLCSLSCQAVAPQVCSCIGVLVAAIIMRRYWQPRDQSL